MLNEEVWPLLFYPFRLLLLNTILTARVIHDAIHIDDPSYELTLQVLLFHPFKEATLP